FPLGHVGIGTHLIPRRLRERQTDRRDALKLARSYRSGDLTPVVIFWRTRGLSSVTVTLPTLIWNSRRKPFRPPMSDSTRRRRPRSQNDLTPRATPEPGGMRSSLTIECHLQ